ncbi:sulfurtransferase FdhD [Sphingomonas spermidinifaciens]|uniref:Sulfur carrier protein FdhD n=1 Tax=Sphingomonas spermidinifaciens TaxID=1141889 RepID=A0A2A4B2L9_9SPHN|nr:formate dehydrogenase accessory sulfurtransferase FdhD [Sphingomonas spermidinifaciens]PCD01978.1 sulfurtransferase FdhD [Sphingomonas spermidinifaciens]
MTASISFIRIGADGVCSANERAVAAEVPIAVEFNGIGYAVLMATPADLDDLVTGFALAERLVEGADELPEIDAHQTERGIIVRATLVPERAARAADRVRHRVSESSCGLCGIENLEQALRPLPRVTATSEAQDVAIFAALAALRDHQPLNRETGGVHAAALVASDGTIRLAREDVGRHNAFDKLIGAMARQGLDWDGGFALLSSRCSFELVEKAALAGCPLLVTVSAPTALAVERAREAGVRLVVLARSDAMLAVAP